MTNPKARKMFQNGTRKLDLMLSQEGFLHDFKNRVTGKGVSNIWQRNADWRIDRLNVLRQSDPFLGGWRLFVGISCEVPWSGERYRFCSLGVPALAKRPNPGFYVCCNEADIEPRMNEVCEDALVAVRNIQRDFDSIGAARAYCRSSVSEGRMNPEYGVEIDKVLIDLERGSGAP